MEDIKVGEYVRTKEGYIFRITKIGYCYITNKPYRNQKGYSGIYDSTTKDFYLCLKEEQAKECKYSFDIIELIEAGDYVNGYRVVDVVKPEHGIWASHPTVELDCGGEDNVIFSYQIKSVVTKEQFESMKYVVGDK